MAGLDVKASFSSLLVRPSSSTWWDPWFVDLPFDTLELGQVRSSSRVDMPSVFRPRVAVVLDCEGEKPAGGRVDDVLGC